MRARMLLVIWGLGGLGGCGDRLGLHVPPEGAAAARMDEPIGVQMMRVEPQLRTQRFSTLISFESRSDPVFVTPAGGHIERSNFHAHSGRYSLRLDAPEVRIKLSSLVPVSAIAGKWSLLGGYLYAPDGARATVALEVGSARMPARTIKVPAGRWTPLMVDLSALGDVPRRPKEAPATASLLVRIESVSPVWLDDLMLIENAHTLYSAQNGDDEAGRDSLFGAWTISRQGLYYTVAAPGRFTIQLLTAEAGGGEGWIAEEAHAMRARFRSDGSQKSLTIYPDGRAYWDGSYRPLSAAAAEPQYVQQHVAPASVTVAEELGRVDRDTPGDADNDGYNESRGAYQIRANGPRLEIAFTPRTASVVRPVIEIMGMPPGKPLVTLEGRLVADVMRLPDGVLLIDIPARINRATTIYVKIQ